MLFENEAMLQKWREWTNGDLYQALGQLLTKDVVLNAAGVVASLVMFTHPEMYLKPCFVVHLKGWKEITKAFKKPTTCRTNLVYYIC